MRSLLFVPANNPRMVEKAAGLDADAIVLDLEDSVPLDAKAAARAAARAAIATLVRPGRQVWVRISSTYTLLARDDVYAVVAPGLDGIVLPKCDRPEQVRYLEALLRDVEPAAGIEAGKLRLIPAIESAAGLLKAHEIAGASVRVIALLLGGEDFAADLGVERTREGAELAYARGALAVAARAARVAAFDTIYGWLNEEPGLVRDAETARSLGFSGKFVIHPAQIEPVNRVFTPDPAAIARVRGIIAAYDAAAKDGHGAVQVEGALVDAPVVSRAKALLARAGVPERDADPAAESNTASPAAQADAVTREPAPRDPAAQRAP